MSQSPSKEKNRSLVYWLVAIFLLMSGIAAPIGFLMIVVKLLSGSTNSRAKKAPSGPVGARTTGTGTARQQSVRREQHLIGLAKKSRRYMVTGAALAIVFGFAALTVLPDALYWLMEGDATWFVQALLNLIPTLCFVAGGLGCLWVGTRKKKQIQRFRSYLAMVGSRQVIPIASLAATAGLSAKQVREDLEEMLNEGLFSPAYLDYGKDRLVLSGEGIQEEPAPQKPTPQEQENAILAEIRTVNDAIQNETISAQIDRIGVITARILDYQKSHPEKSPQLHSFLSYYLPTTLKILRAYGQLEAQGVSGENITAAMARIEGMMDKVVEGFEKQLDQLFQGDAMDITTDVEVLERMLAKDGLSGQQGMTLGV